MKTGRALFVVMIAVTVLAGAAYGGTIYVDANASGADNGSSWTDAYIYLQDALVSATSGDDIWVAEGTYKPDHGTGVTIGDPNAFFALKAGVGMYGGFPVGGGTWEDRDPNLYETILSGDLNGDDQPGFLNYEENSLGLCSIDWTVGATTVDGFSLVATFVHSDIPKGSGAIVNRGGQMTVENCKFLNHCLTGGIYFTRSDSNPDATLTGSTISNCLFQNCWWGVRGSWFSPVIRKCIFKDSDYVAIETGAPYRVEGLTANAKIIDCKFLNNNHVMVIYSMKAWPETPAWANPTVINCAFIGNTGWTIGIRGESTSKFISCTFTANTPSSSFSRKWPVPSLFSNESFSGKGSTTLLNCTIAGNSGYTICANSVDTPYYLTNCILWGSGGVFRS